jgi:hypothetical protein
LGFVLGVSTTGAALSYAGGSKGKGACLDDVTPNDGFRYFSGTANPLHNHPAMYASGSDTEAKLTVVGVNVDSAFPMAEPDAAFAAYRALLVDRGYLPTSPP